MKRVACPFCGYQTLVSEDDIVGGERAADPCPHGCNMKRWKRQVTSYEPPATHSMEAKGEGGYLGDLFAPSDADRRLLLLVVGSDPLQTAVRLKAQAMAQTREVRNAKIRRIDIEGTYTGKSEATTIEYEWQAPEDDRIDASRYLSESHIGTTPDSFDYLTIDNSATEVYHGIPVFVSEGIATVDRGP